MEPTRHAIRELATQVMTGQLEPVEGARRIAEEAARLDDPGDLTAFGELARAGDDEAILEQTQLLLADTA